MSRDLVTFAATSPEQCREPERPTARVLRSESFGGRLVTAVVHPKRARRSRCRRGHQRWTFRKTQCGVSSASVIRAEKLMAEKWPSAAKLPSAGNDDLSAINLSANPPFLDRSLASWPVSNDFASLPLSGSSRSFFLPTSVPRHSASVSEILNVAPLDQCLSTVVRHPSRITNLETRSPGPKTPGSETSGAKDRGLPAPGIASKPPTSPRTQRFPGVLVTCPRTGPEHACQISRRAV